MGFHHHHEDQTKSRCTVGKLCTVEKNATNGDFQEIFWNFDELVLIWSWFTQWYQNLVGDHGGPGDASWGFNPRIDAYNSHPGGCSRSKRNVRHLGIVFPPAGVLNWTKATTNLTWHDLHLVKCCKHRKHLLVTSASTSASATTTTTTTTRRYKQTLGPCSLYTSFCFYPFLKDCGRWKDKKGSSS